MARRANSNAGIWLIGGLVLIIAMCRGGSNDIPTLPANTSVAPAPRVSVLPPQTETMYVATSVLNQRSSPNGAVVAKASGGDSLTVYERKDDWVRVSPDGASQRWVASRLLCSGSGCYSPPVRKQPSNRTDRPNRSYYNDSGCPCSGNRVCIGPRGGRYCITSGGNKRYGV